MKTKVKHSESKSAWNIVGDELGGKFKIARIPYFIDNRLSEELNALNRKEALEIANFISESLLKFKQCK